MIRETDPLPDPPDLDAAKRLIAALDEQRRALEDKLITSQREIASLRHKLDVLCRRLFGKKSEKVDPRQLALALEQLRGEGGIKAGSDRYATPTPPQGRPGQCLP